MKQIQPISIWKNGALKTASILDAIIINDNMSLSCTFYYMLKEVDRIIDDQTITGESLAEGNVNLSGEDYNNWNGSNDAAYEFVAASINVIIVN